jgi:cytochrome P450
MYKKVEESQVFRKVTGSTRPIIYEQIVNGMKKTDSKKLLHLKDMIIVSEMLDHILAGHEITAITLTYIMYELSRQPVIQSKLRDEVRTLFPLLKYSINVSDLPSPRSMDALPLLDAVIQKTFRRYPAAAGSEPRVTPPGLTTIGDYSGIPGGVRISANQYTLHRNAKVFPDFEAWKPERWLEAGKK